MDVYLQGFLMGLAYVAPIGVQNLFVINSAISQKRGCIINGVDRRNFYQCHFFNKKS